MLRPEIRLVPLFAVLALFGLTGGCPFLQSPTEVVLQNDAAFTVRAVVYYHSNQLIPEALLKEVGQRFEVDVPPGETRSLSRDCDRIQAVYVEGDLRIIGGIGPSADTAVYRDGTHFNCGDRLRFTFTDRLLSTQLDIAFARE